ncbi:hypothetical protein CACET_c30380 [Clostridium aceticum]|uniref:Uncharacterized protein n=1 Tax=Clostridium aceticum TaxID=84022 RepID=A0A0D8IDU4_9CLOT|nr:DUF819 family protein [Clostridium aceticum]AKL96482.1 hypothetical protein CACET_c30380 [Clostridium aceticum]KJF27346.1 hypothetical protein TZ02_08395 [Clostridium aceticum]
MSLISGDNTIMVWAIVLCIAFIALVVEKKRPSMPAFITAIILALALVSIRLMPTSSSVYRTINSFIMPMALPMFFFSANVKKIFKETGRLFIVFHIACIGSVVAVLITLAITGRFFEPEHIPGIVAMYVGAHTGGTLNLAAMAETFNLPDTITATNSIVSNLSLAVLIFVITLVWKSEYFRNMFKGSNVISTDNDIDKKQEESQVVDEKKVMSVFTVAQALALSALILAISGEISKFVGTLGLPENIELFVGNTYLIITLITVSLATIFPNYFEKIHGSTSIGAYLLIFYFISIGSSTTVTDVIINAPIFILNVVLIGIISLFFTVLVSRFFKAKLPEALLSTAAAFGGPGTTVAVNTANGWNDLIAPGILISIYGYVIGNYLGVIVGNIMSSL